VGCGENGRAEGEVCGGGHRFDCQVENSKMTKGGASPRGNFRVAATIAILIAAAVRGAERIYWSGKG